MGLLKSIKNRFRNRSVNTTQYKMIIDNGEGFYTWNGNLYQSDIIRSAIRPKVRAIGKAIGKHVRQSVEGTKVNPEPYIRFLLEEPNPYMSGQQLQEKLITQLELNNNAFAYIRRDTNGLPMEIYPINAITFEALQDDRGLLYLKFQLPNARTVTFRYSDVIHLRKDFNQSEIFGEPNGGALASLMEIVTTTDQGIVKAIKNSNVIRWLLKFNQTLRPEDLRKQTKIFVESFLDTETSESIGAAGTDAKMDAKQVEPKDYVPNERQMSNTVKRIYSFFNTNEKIVNGTYSENEWISFYESVVEPDIIQLSNEYTRKLFTRRERGFGNKIVFESANLAFASMQTKLNLTQYVDRGIMTPNEVREILNMAPIEGGDKPVRRLDTMPVNE